MKVGLKIMLLDDEAITNFITIRLLKKIGVAMDIKDHTDPSSAMAYLESTNPDIIFLDLSMPKMSGWEFMDNMITKGMKHKVVILSSSVSSIDAERALKYEIVVDFLQKPTSRETLEKCLALHTV